MALTWTDLSDDIKIRGMIPTNNTTFNSARLLNLTNAVLKSRIVPIIHKTREDYYSWDFDTNIASVTVAGSPTSVRIPARSVGAGVETCALIDSTRRQQLCRYYEHELDDLTLPIGNNPGYFIKRNLIYILPNDGNNWSTLRITVQLRPNLIVDPSSAAQITGIASNVVTVSSMPSSWATSNTFDIIQADNNYDWWAIDQTITALTSTTITFTTAPPSTVQVGDWVALARQSPVVQCPEEMYPLLAQEVANIYLKSLGNQAGYQLGLEEAKLIREDVERLLTPRAHEDAKKIATRSGILRRRF